MSRESSVPPPAAASATDAPPPRRRRWWLAVLAVSLSVLIAGGAALLGSESGLRLSCLLLERLAAGQLVIATPSGTLASSFLLRSLHWRSETLDVQVQELQVDWRPAELLRGRLAVGRIAADRLRVSQMANDDPVVLPESLELPLAVAIERLEIAVVEVGDHAHPDGAAATIAESLAAELTSDGALHRLLDLRARVAGLALSGDASLAAAKPFALIARAAIEGEAGGRALAFDLAAEGRLEEFAVHGRARPLAAAPADGFVGEVDARILPFAPQVLGEAVAR
ncbi:MAG TPA: hypothetical protein PK752_20495, partial [Accumulibacter sp.]|nr:hypothetical protein [Accumulibacter sp.]